MGKENIQKKLYDIVDANNGEHDLLLGEKTNDCSVDIIVYFKACAPRNVVKQFIAGYVHGQEMAGLPISHIELIPRQDLSNYIEWGE